MEQLNQNRLISMALLKWTSLLTLKQITNFEQLTTGQFYLELLSCVKEFKLIKPIKGLSFSSQQTQTLANRVSNIKTIGDSVVRYYQIHLMRDISQMKINYVQMCMGNCQEAIKLFSLVVGIFVEQEGDVLRKFEQALDNLDPDDQYIVKALLENTKTIGDSMNSIENSPMQKKIITRLEVYEQKIENLQFQNQHLRLQLEEQRQKKEAFQASLKQLNTQKAKLMQKAEIFEVLNSRLQSQNSSFILQNQNLVKKLESQKRHYDQILVRNQQKLTSYEKEIKLIDSMKVRIDELRMVNIELKQQLTQQIDSSRSEQNKFKMMKENYKLLQDNFTKVQTRLSDVELELQELRYKYQTDSAIKPKNKLMQSPAYHFSNNSQLSSLKYRMRDRIESALKGQLSQYQMVNSNIVRKQSKERNKQSGQLNYRDSTFMNGEHLISSTRQYHNLSNFVINEIGNPNMKNIDDVSEFDEEGNGAKRLDHEEVLDRSIIMDEEELEKEYITDRRDGQTSEKRLNRQVRQCGETNNQVIRSGQENRQQKGTKIVDLVEDKAQQQYQLLIQVISQLYEQREGLRKQLRKYQTFRSKKQSRLQQFKKKLSQIRDMQPIQQINLNYEAMKENLNFINIQHTNSAQVVEKQAQREEQGAGLKSSRKHLYYQVSIN